VVTSATLRTSAPFEIVDPAFRDVLGADPQLVRVAETDAHEGPVYVAAEDALYFTSVPVRGDDPVPGTPVVAIRRLQLDGDDLSLHRDALSTVVPRSNVANGMTLCQDGCLVVCEQGTRTDDAAIAAVDPVSGERDVIVDAWRGLPLNSPNDVAVAPDGAIWFTDPSYGHLQGFRPQPQSGDYVYRHDPLTGRTSVAADDFDKPNGIAFSPDGSVLYVTDSGANHELGSYDPTRPHHVVAFDVRGAHLVNRRLLTVTTPGFPDGITVDAAGRVYASSFAGVQVLAPEGDLLGQINLPGAVNFTFGGPDRNVLFITADTAIWAAVLDAKGAD
jgi:gluconolactonase